MALNDDLYSQTLRRRALLSMYERTLATELDKLLVNHNRRLVRIAQNSTALNATVIAAFNREIRATYRRIYNMALTELDRLYASEANFNKSLLNRSLRGIYDARGIPTGSSIRNLLIRDNKNLAMHLASISATQRGVVSSVVRTGLANSLSNQQIISNIRRRATKLSRLQVTTLTRTAVTQVTNDASDKVYQANSDVIRGYQYVATLDGRTSIICGRLDGRVFALNSEFKPRPPQHFNCRSTTVPVTRSAGAISNIPGNNRINKGAISRLTEARRASINGAVPARLTYPEWLRTQGNDVKLHLLGSQQRVKIFNEGNLTLTQFSNRDGKLLSIERLDELTNQ